ncbi:MAG: FRG domain-containing protein [Methylococcaceae bacterium]
MPHIPEPIWTQIGPGYFEVQFNELKQFIDYIYSDLLNFGAYIWRGHRCDSWTLEPTIARLIRESTIPRTQEWDFEKEHLDAFKHAARGRRGPNPPLINDENEWWALGQHQGLATPLLDWTTSPFVATFFAFSTVGREQTPYRAIFALHQPSVKSIVELARSKENVRRKEMREELKKAGKALSLGDWATIGSKAEPDLIFVRPLSDENQRLVSQGGLFTRSRTNLSIEDWVMKHQEAADSGLTLLKCLVPDSERSKCLQLLNRMNINPLSLFPDLTGASTYCNLFSEIDNY